RHRSRACRSCRAACAPWRRSRHASDSPPADSPAAESARCQCRGRCQPCPLRMVVMAAPNASCHGVEIAIMYHNAMEREVLTMGRQISLTRRTALAGGLATLAAPQVLAQTPIAMKIGMVTINDPIHALSNRFAEEIEKRTGGRIKGQAIPARQPGK